MAGKKIFMSDKFGTYKMTSGGNAKMVERIQGDPATSNHDVDHFEIWEQNGKHYLFCFEVGSTYYGNQFPADKLDDILAASAETLKGFALDAIYI